MLSKIKSRYVLVQIYKPQSQLKNGEGVRSLQLHIVPIYYIPYCDQSDFRADEVTPHDPNLQQICLVYLFELQIYHQNQQHNLKIVIYDS